MKAGKVVRLELVIQVEIITIKYHVSNEFVANFKPFNGSISEK
jgi:hypothetical protein